MTFLLFNAYFQRRARRKLRSAMRGDRVLSITDQREAIDQIREAFVTAQLGCDWEERALIFGAAAASAKLSVRQYLLARLDGIRLSQALLCFLGNPKYKCYLPLPPEWRNILLEKGFGVAKLKAKLIWFGYICMYYTYGVSLLLKKIISSCAAIILKSNVPLGRVAYFFGLSSNTLPLNTDKKVSYDVLTWYANRVGRSNKIDTICHSVKNSQPSSVGDINIVEVEGPFPAIDKLRPLIKFTAWGIAASITALFDILCGRWSSALMLAEAVKAAQARYLEPNLLAQEYLFSNATYIYRPLWSYEVEKLGSKIVLYFYSTNIQPFKRSNSKQLGLFTFYKLMNWPCYWVWDQYQADFLKNELECPHEVFIMGPIWYSTSAKEIPTLSPSTVAVFDVQPLRASFYKRLGVSFYYYTPENCLAFLADINEVSRTCGTTLAFKRKRNVGAFIHPAYESYIEKMKASELIMTVDPDASAFELLERCSAVISMPFTSTALIGQAMGKPSVYYDPNSEIQKDDSACHGVPILQGPKELHCWLSGLVK